MWHDQVIMNRFCFPLLSLSFLACKPTIPCQEGFVRGEDGACYPEGPLFDSGDLKLPEPTQDLWNWQIVGEAQLNDPGGTNAQWSGSSTWTYSSEISDKTVCRMALKTRAFGSEPFCEMEPQCDWAFLVEHYDGVTQEGDCAGAVGLDDGEQVAVWQLGYAASWSDSTGSEEEGVLIAWTTAGEESGEGWVPVGRASLEERQFQYEFDPIQFYVFTE